MPNSFTPDEISQILEEFFKAVGTRQYIGARYVPIFGRRGETSIQWDDTAPYEPLTIVLYQGNSYTSRQYVPEGVEITNELFWALTGNYNAQVEAYRREVQGFSDRIEAIETSDVAQNAQIAGTTDSGLKTLITTNTEHLADIDEQLAGTTDSGLKSLIEDNSDAIEQNAINIAAQGDQLAGTTDSGLKALITANTDHLADVDAQLAGTTDSGLKDLIETNADDIAQLKLDVGKSAYEGAKSIGFGDSNMAGGEAGATQNTYYQICEKLGCTYDNRGVNGATFALTGNNRIKDVIDAATADNDVRLVVLIGGINDYHYIEYNVTSFRNAVSECVNECLTKYPNADICLIWDQGRQHPNARMLRYPHAMATLANYSSTRKIIVAPTFDLSFNDSLYASQNHWNGSGCSIVAQRACALLTNGSLYPALTYRIAVNPSGEVTGCLAVVQKIAHLDSYTIEQHADINFAADFQISSGFSTLFELPMGIDGAIGARDKYFDTSIILADNMFLFLNFRQFAENYESLTDSPVLTVRNRYAITQNHVTAGCRISIPLRPQQ